MKLGVNIDHIATLREARKIQDPDPLEAIFIAKNLNISQITLHLREDRRHIQDDDITRIIQSCPLPINIECANDEKIIDFICQQKPYRITLVPEKREEVTTEGGLMMQNKNLKQTIQYFKKHQIKVATFIDPNLESIELSKEYGADSIELHTGLYANIFLMLYSQLKRTKNSIQELLLPPEELEIKLQEQISAIRLCAKDGRRLGLDVFAGHGLNYANVNNIASITEISELNIGHSIIARSLFVGLEQAIKEMLRLIKR